MEKEAMELAAQALHPTLQHSLFIWIVYRTLLTK